MSGFEHIPQEELASFAMQNSAPAESASIRAHLQECASCQAELEQTRSDLALIGLSVEQVALPERARDRFLARIAPPAVISSRSRKHAIWIPWAVAAGLAIATIGLTVQNRALNNELKGESMLVSNLAVQASRAQQVLEVLTAPQAQRVTLTAANQPAQPTARATYLPDRGALLLLATHLKPLPADKAYQLWIIPADGKPPVPAGVFAPDAAGTATLVLPRVPRGVAAKALGITIENAAGASTPTMPIVLAGAVGS